MYETGQKYSECKYYSKADLEAEMDHYLVEPLWNEIVHYRNFFKMSFHIKDRKSYLIRNPYVNDCMSSTQECMVAYAAQHMHEPLHNLDCFWLHEDEVFMYQSFVSKMQHQTYYDHAKMLSYLIEQTNLTKTVSKTILNYVLKEHTIWLQLFLCCMELDKRTAFLLYYPILAQHGMLVVCNCIACEDLIEICAKKSDDLDVTGKFLSFLNYIRLKLSSEMVSLKACEEHDVCEMQTQELIYKYPMLHKEQIMFYTTHREIHHFYTLRNYMDMHACCYETARYSMEQLVQMKWYQKQKMGKKFVYFIL